MTLKSSPAGESSGSDTLSDSAGQRRTAPPTPQDHTSLIVEDSPSSASMIADVLGERGFRVQTVGTGAEAIELCSERAGLLMLLDFRLPDMQAPSVVKALQRQGFNIPFIVMTSQGDEKTAVEMMKLGARDYLVKDNAFLSALPVVINQVLRQLATERLLRAAESKLREREERLRAITSALPDTVYVLENSGYCLELLTADTQVDGLRRIKGRNVRDVFPRPLAELFMATVERTLRTGKIQILEYPQQVDGERVPGQLPPAASP